jgi:outer membrane protein TolC
MAIPLLSISLMVLVPALPAQRVLAQVTPPRPLTTAPTPVNAPSGAPTMPSAGATSSEKPSAPASSGSASSDVAPPWARGVVPTTGTSSALPPLTGAVGLGDALREADARNSDIIAAKAAIASAQARVQQAVRTPLQFVVQPGLSEDVPGGVGRLQQLSAGVVQQVAPGLKVLRTIAAFDVTLARGLADATTRDVRQRIVDAYYTFGATQVRIAAAEQNLQSANDLVTAAQLRQRAGAVGGFEVLRATIEARRAQTELFQARSALRQNAIALSVLVGRPVDPAASISIEPQPAVDATFGAAAAIDRALTRDPTSSQLRAALARSSAQLDVARAQRRPVLSIAAGYLLQRAPELGNRTSHGPTASFGIGIPIVDFGTIRGAEREAQANAATARAQISGREVQLRASIEGARAAIESSRARLDFSGDSLRQAEQGLRIAQIGFRQGALGTLDVISARTAATTARADRDQARGEYAAAVAKLHILLGDPIAP